MMGGDVVVNMDSEGEENSSKFVGCCGAYCKTCKPFVEGSCKGCTLGYENKERSINRSKCEIKLCCFRDNKLETCADCSKYLECDTLNNFYNKNGYKYKKYQQNTEFIRENGYLKFVMMANNWKNAYGKLK
jgi:hypothetical protein